MKVVFQVHKLEIEYAQKYAPLYQRRAAIVSGEVEPSPMECVMPGEEQDNEKSDSEKQVIIYISHVTCQLVTCQLITCTS